MERETLWGKKKEVGRIFTHLPAQNGDYTQLKKT
jgi:hypothetical protein